MGVFRSGAVPPQMRAGPGGTGGTGSEPGLRTGYWDGVPVPPGAAPSTTSRAMLRRGHPSTPRSPVRRHGAAPQTRSHVAGAHTWAG